MAAWWTNKTYVYMYVHTLTALNVRKSPITVLGMLIGDAVLSLGRASLFSLHFSFHFVVFLNFYKQFLILFL